VGECKAWGKRRVYYHDVAGQVRALPVDWTDLSAEEPVRNGTEGRSVFRAAELLELVRLLERLRGVCKGNYVVNVNRIMSIDDLTD